MRSSASEEVWRRFAFIGNYTPRQCGIATFTCDLCEALGDDLDEKGEVFAVAMNDIPEGYRYPHRVRFEVDQSNLSQYRLAANFLNMNQVEVVCVQHEYGIFGGPSGSHLLPLLRDLRMPVVTTLHTVLKDPSEIEKRVLAEISELSDRLVVMSEHGQEFLKDIYGVPKEKIRLIHHGIPDVPFTDPSYYKSQFGVEGRKVMLTFGLLSPGKGIENVIQALPEIVKEHPDMVYIVLGATHPAIRRASGEDYRHGLQHLIREKGMSDHVLFQNRFVEIGELCAFLGCADLYVTPYLNVEQTVSGTLAYALGAGKAVVSTPYWYAEEMLQEGRGRVVPFKKPEAISEQVVELFTDTIERDRIRKRAYEHARGMIWEEVAKEYRSLFDEVREERSRSPKRVPLSRKEKRVIPDLPDICFDHLRVLSDDTGIYQHARFNVPNPHDGYTTDDNARALIVAMRAQMLGEKQDFLHILASRYLGFLLYAFDEKTGRFRNFMSFDRQWIDTAFSEDAHARALWALGTAVGIGKDEGLVGLAATLFEQAILVVDEFEATRSMAFTLLGIHEFLRRFSGASETRRIRADLATRLFERFEKNASEDWVWMEDMVSYASGRIPHALLLSGQWMQRGDIVEMGLKCLEWLMKIQTQPEGHFAAVGQNGWYPKGKRMARFDQQPIEANAMLEACMEAYHLTRDERWLEEVRRCFEWFLGRNDLGIPVCNFANGGCRDALQSDRLNLNQGAESTCVWLMSLLMIHLQETSLVTEESGKTP